jgi:fucose 4-O-acetylase-like acetyltransferase
MNESSEMVAHGANAEANAASTPTALAPTRDRSLDQAKGILIALVVIGHLVSARVHLPPQFAWYESLRATIYLFHMPAFFFVSGVIFTLSSMRSKTPVMPWLAKRADRLLVPFVLMGLMIFFGKYAAQTFIHVDHFHKAPTFAETVRDGLDGLFIHTGKSPSTSIWFLFTYFVCLVIAAPLARIRHGRFLMLAITGLLYFAPPVPLFYFDHLVDNSVFFALGWIYGGSDDLRHKLKTFVPGWAICLALLLLLFPALDFGSLGLLWRLVFGTSASLIILWAMKAEASPLLDTLGRASMIIYIANTPIIGLVRGGYLKLHAFDAAFVSFLVVSCILAIGIPILVRSTIVSRSLLLRRYLG